jgi:hypothetical protein
VRRAAALAAVAVAVGIGVGGCGGCGGSDEHRAGPPKPRLSVADEAVIRLWSRAQYEGQYRRAASFFARGAVVHQAGTLVLRSRADAVAFSRGLSCRPTVKGIRPLGAGMVTVAFNLGPGRAGGCQSGGSVSVRFELRGGRIISWRQLPDRR